MWACSPNATSTPPSWPGAMLNMRVSAALAGVAGQDSMASAATSLARRLPRRAERPPVVTAACLDVEQLSQAGKHSILIPVNLDRAGERSAGDRRLHGNGRSEIPREVGGNVGERRRPIGQVATLPAPDFGRRLVRQNDPVIADLVGQGLAGGKRKPFPIRIVKDRAFRDFNGVARGTDNDVESGADVDQPVVAHLDRER